MQQYHDLLRKILYEGIRKDDRTGTGTLSVFGPQLKFDLTKGFPLVTTKRVFWRGVVEELLWILSGSTNNNDLEDKGVSIWREWAREGGDLGPIYGAQFRSWNKLELKQDFDYDDEPTEWIENKTIDQIQNTIDLLKSDPDSRRIVVSAWNVADLDDMALAPCHCLFQFYTRNLKSDERLVLFLKNHDYSNDWTDAEFKHYMEQANIPKRYLDCQLYQRSCDVFLGGPFNFASYALLTHMIAREVNMVPGEFVWTGGDTHLYLNHIDQAHEQLSREPRTLPTVRFADGAPGIFELTSDHIILDGYDPHPKIEAPVAV